MAIKLSDQYPGRADAPSIDYPNGSFKNRSAPGVLDGTPLDKAWANDKEGFFQGILAEAGITADGQPDKVGSSQYLDALKTVIGNEAPTPDQATESTPGIAKIATVSSASGFINNTDIITPERLASALGLRVGHTFSSNDWAPLPGGLIIQWGTTASLPAGVSTVTLPKPYSTSNLFTTISASGPYAGGNSQAHDSSYDKTLTNFKIHNGSNVASPFSFLSIGY